MGVSFYAKAAEIKKVSRQTANQCGGNFKGDRKLVNQLTNKDLICTFNGVDFNAKLTMQTPRCMGGKPIVTLTEPDGHLAQDIQDIYDIEKQNNKYLLDTTGYGFNQTEEISTVRCLIKNKTTAKTLKNFKMSRRLASSAADVYDMMCNSKKMFKKMIVMYLEEKMKSNDPKITKEDKKFFEEYLKSSDEKRDGLIESYPEFKEVKEDFYSKAEAYHNFLANPKKVLSSGGSGKLGQALLCSTTLGIKNDIMQNGCLKMNDISVSAEEIKAAVDICEKSI